MSTETFSASQSNGPHRELARLEGRWHGMTKTYFEPNVLADESPWTGTIVPVLDGRFMKHEYSGSLQGKPLTGIAIYGYNVAARRYQSAWVDSFHNGTAIMFSQQERTEKRYTVLGSYDTTDGSPAWGWRTEITVLSDDHIRITMFNITPEGQEAKAVETDYFRQQSSPA